MTVRLHVFLPFMKNWISCNVNGWFAITKQPNWILQRCQQVMHETSQPLDLSWRLCHRPILCFCWWVWHNVLFMCSPGDSWVSHHCYISTQRSSGRSTRRPICITVHWQSQVRIWTKKNALTTVPFRYRTTRRAESQWASLGVCINWAKILTEYDMSGRVIDR